MSAESDKKTPTTSETSPTKNRSSDRRLADLEQRLRRVEKRVKNNERFAKTVSDCFSSQVVASDAVMSILRKNLKTDAAFREEFEAMIKEYDHRKISRWCSGFIGVIFRVLSLAVAAFVGAFIYWVFSGQ